MFIVTCAVTYFSHFSRDLSISKCALIDLLLKRILHSTYDLQFWFYSPSDYNEKTRPPSSYTINRIPILSERIDLPLCAQSMQCRVLVHSWYVRSSVFLVTKLKFGVLSLGKPLAAAILLLTDAASTSRLRYNWWLQLVITIIISIVALSSIAWRERRERYRSDTITQQLCSIYSLGSGYNDRPMTAYLPISWRWQYPFQGTPKV